ncbi:MAG TPA: AAA family ATPase [Polyangiaceae bacterium]
MATTTETHPCSVCGTTFQPELAYQVEQREVRDASGDKLAETAYYCSLDCFSQSHESAGRAQCDMCSRTFVVELVSQVVNHRGRRHHACSATCRQRLLDRLNGGTLRPEAPTNSATTSATRAVPPAIHGLSSGSTNVTRSPARVPSNTTTFDEESTSSVTSIASRSGAPMRSPTKPLTSAQASTEAPAAMTESVQWKRIEASLEGRTQVLAVFNHKGGTGKTTTAVTLAAGLASRGQRVLLVDTDGQGNVGVSLGLQKEKTLYHVLVMGLDPAEAIVEVRPNLHVLPANETLAAAELFLAGRQRRDRVLASRLGGLRAHYDAIIVDCSPSLSLMNQNALVFADGVLCPVACDYLSIVGVRQVLRTIKQVNRLLSHPVRLWGVLPTLYDARARVCVEAYDTLRQHFGDRCLQPIRMASRAKEAPSQSQTLFEYAPDATAAKDYWLVVEQFIREASGQDVGSPQAVAGGAR